MKKTASALIFILFVGLVVGVVEANPYTFDPGIYVYSPTPEQVYWEPNVEISFKIILENNATPQIDSFFYTLDNKANSPLTFSRDTEDHFVNNVKHTINTILVHKTLANLTDGIHRIAVFANYSDGTIKSILYRSITVDTTLPNPYTPFTPVIISPLNQTIYNARELPLNYTIEKEILWSYYSIDSYDDLKYFEGNITLSSLSEGQHWLTLNVITTTGPGSQQPYSTGQIILFDVDTTAPKVGNLTVSNTNSGDRLLSFTVDTETSWVGYSLDNQANVTVAGDVVLGDLSFGSHSVTVYAEDAAGNIGASETLLFTVESFPTTLTVASFSIVAVVAIGLLVYLKKCRKTKSD